MGNIYSIFNHGLFRRFHYAINLVNTESNEHGLKLVIATNRFKHRFIPGIFKEHTSEEVFVKHLYDYGFHGRVHVVHTYYTIMTQEQFELHDKANVLWEQLKDGREIRKKMSDAFNGLSETNDKSLIIENHTKKNMKTYP